MRPVCSQTSSPASSANSRTDTETEHLRRCARRHDLARPRAHTDDPRDPPGHHQQLVVGPALRGELDSDGEAGSAPHPDRHGDARQADRPPKVGVPDRKAVLVLGLAIFAMSTAASAAALNGLVLILFRAMTGLGAALVLPNSLAILAASVPVPRRRRAIATWAAMSGFAGVFGNLGGGLALSSGSWHLLLLLVAPLAIALLVVVAIAVPAVARHERRVDVLGSVLLTAAILTLLLGIILGPEQHWTGPVVICAFIASVACWTLWVAVGLRS